MQISYEPHGSGELTQLLRDNVALFNVAATGMSEYYPVAFFVRTAAGEVVGGLAGHMWGGWLEIGVLWVAEFLRGRGYGSALMAEAEKLAMERGCLGIHLDTFSFQAPGFYLKQGFQVYAVLEDCPQGHQRIYLSKSLRG